MRAFISLLVAFLSFSLYATDCGGGTTYEMNMCLKKKMHILDQKVEGLKNIDQKTKSTFKSSRKSLCEGVSSEYQGGTFQSVSYGLCYVSFTKWFLNES
tara:strand:- start:682 stop:978 length:297 start_codon:yes stop_codon:yes gene_type:complete